MATAAFTDELKRTIEERRTFGRHPLWRKIAEGGVSRESLGVFAVQFFLQVREFPRAVSAMHANCPFADERVKLAESLYEEETGRISGVNLPHPEVFIRFGEALGLERNAMVDGVPLAETAALIDWFELSTKQRSFIEGAAAIALAAEGQVPGSFGPFARALERHYGLSRDAVAFWDVHEEADRDHADVGNHIVFQFATTPDVQAAVRLALHRSLELWWSFFDGMARAIG